MKVENGILSTQIVRDLALLLKQAEKLFKPNMPLVLPADHHPIRSNGQVHVGLSA